MKVSEYVSIGLFGAIFGFFVWLIVAMIFFSDDLIIRYRKPDPPDYGLWQPMTCRMVWQHGHRAYGPSATWECLPPIDQTPINP